MQYFHAINHNTIFGIVYTDKPDHVQLLFAQGTADMIAEVCNKLRPGAKHEAKKGKGNVWYVTVQPIEPPINTPE